MPVQLYTDIGKAFSSYKTWRIKRAALPVQVCPLLIPFTGDNR
jgi:hypothetical protein